MHVLDWRPWAHRRLDATGVPAVGAEIGERARHAFAAALRVVPDGTYAASLVGDGLPVDGAAGEERLGRVHERHAAQHRGLHHVLSMPPGSDKIEVRDGIGPKSEASSGKASSNTTLRNYQVPKVLS